MSEAFRIGVLASGRGSNFRAIVEAIATGHVPATVAVLLSDRAEAAALEIARAHGIPARFVDPGEHPSRDAFDKALIGALDQHRVGLVCLAGYMRILTSSFVQHFAGRLLNIHPSLLPAFPGLHAARQALAHGVKMSGATVHFVDDGVDSGSIVLQAAVPVRDDDTEATLAARILTEEHRLYPEAVRLFVAGRLSVEGRRVHILETP
ncbi:MAG TPA: phosphoribosylglycinamide formyltransferase [Candidatus Limnocylindrales bacterium]|nr:phosphoribosylglycinamide formyltransferase [Candidatus Limnocylindrales bacterium]